MSEYLHDYGCTHGTHSDPAKRLSDTYNMHYVADPNNLGKWFAVALADARSDNTIYDNRHDAVYHQHHNENYYAFIKIVPSSMSPCAAESFLKMVRMQYEAQKRLNDRNHPHGGYEIIPRLNAEDQARQDELIFKNWGTIAVGNR